MMNSLLSFCDVTVFQRIFVALQQVSGDQTDAGPVNPAFQQGVETASILESIGCDKETIAAALLCAAGDTSEQSKALGQKIIETEGLKGVWPLISSLRSIRALKSPMLISGYQASASEQNQLEVLRRMLLAMVSDERVALVYLASALQQLRSFAAKKAIPGAEICLEALQVLSQLANRLGLWQLKWEIEDLAFRFSEPTTYKQIASLLEEKRQDRAKFIEAFLLQLKTTISEREIAAEVVGRPKHIYSIHKKMQAKNLTISGLSDLHAFRVLVDSVKDCYSVLAVVHEHWEAISSEYDDYIAKPKPNGYQSLHTVIRADDGRLVEIQIRTREMHQFAEYGVASHWRYKENDTGQGSKVSGAQSQEARVAAMRQILAWQNDVAHTIAVPASTHVYAMTPQGRVIELPRGSTPVDFAYHVHSDLGNRCRGAKVNDHLVPLTTQLENGQTVEILASKAVRVTPAEFVLQANRHVGGASSGQGARIGPSRDWLNPQLGFLASARAKTKVRQWFNAIEELSAAREVSEPEVSKPEGKLPVSALDDASELLDSLNKPRTGAAIRNNSASDVLVVGVDFLMTQLAKCCRPLPPDDIEGFVTRGHGISIHRRHCKSFKAMVARSPERSLPCAWGQTPSDASKNYPVEMQVHAYDRQGLLRDITDTLAREKINVTAASTQSKDQIAYMRFTVEVSSATALSSAIASVMGISGVFDAKRRV
jgi:GTP pyrophosphokinase